MNEKDYYPTIGPYYEKRSIYIKRSITWEIKLTKTDSIPFTALLPHQEEKLLQSVRSLSYKIPDTGVARKPFDGITVYNALPMIVLIFYRPRATEMFEIPMSEWAREVHTSERKSLTYERAQKIGRKIDVRYPQEGV